MIKKLLVTSIALAGFSSSQAASVAGTTDFKVTLPAILVLYHWDEAHLDFTQGGTFKVTNSQAHTLTPTTTISAGPYVINQNAFTTANATAPNALTNNINVTLQNSWAVRSIASGPVSLAVARQSSVLKNTTDNNKTIAVGIPTLHVNTIPSGSAPTDSATLALPSNWSPTIGDINFTINLTNATAKGVYTSSGTATRAAASDTFKLTLTGN